MHAPRPVREGCWLARVAVYEGARCRWAELAQLRDSGAPRPSDAVHHWKAGSVGRHWVLGSVRMYRLLQKLCEVLLACRVTCYIC